MEDSDRGSLANLLADALKEATTGKKVNWSRQDVQIERHGKKITLPSDPAEMPINAAISALQRLEKDENTLMDVSETIKAHPLEGAVAFVEALEILYGWASPVPTPTFWGPMPPDFISVQTDVDSWIQVPWGRFVVPGIENPIGISAGRGSSGRFHLIISGSVRKKEQKILLEIAAKTRAILKEKSIYKGKALHITTDNRGNLDFNNPPGFIDLAGVDENELIMSRKVQEQIEVNIYTPIKHTEAVTKAGFPLKRGVLLEGRYGVGKTMTTRITAKICVDNGWTFITIDRPASLKEALVFAQNYQPAVVFCEDIDRSAEKRDDLTNDLLNTVDGILSKSAKVMVVLTTNHVEKIDQAMMRPGRLDAVISVTPPDAEAVERLIRLYARGRLTEGTDLTEASNALAGQIPAVVREIVERSKLAMICHGRDSISGEDLVIAAEGMQAHLALLAPKAPSISVEEEAGRALKALLDDKKTVDEKQDTILQLVNDIHNHTV